MVAQIFVKIDANIYTKRGHNIAMNAANRAGMEFVRDTIFAERFENSPRTRPGGDLGFFARSKSTQMRKAKLYGHQRPNVQTGALRAKVLSGSVVRATAARGSVNADGTFPMPDRQRQEIQNMPAFDRERIVAVIAEKYQHAHTDPALMDRVTLRTRRR